MSKTIAVFLFLILGSTGSAQAQLAIRLEGSKDVVVADKDINGLTIEARERALVAPGKIGMYVQEPATCALLLNAFTKTRFSEKGDPKRIPLADFPGKVIRRHENAGRLWITPVDTRSRTAIHTLWT